MNQPNPVSKPQPVSPQSSDRDRRGLPAAQEVPIAHIVSVSGSQAIAVLEKPAQGANEKRDARIQIGALVKIATPKSTVIGLISAVSSPMPSVESEGPQLGLIELNLAGEVTPSKIDGRLTFHRGVAHLPSLGDKVVLADRHDLTRVYSHPSLATVSVGSLYQDSTVPAKLLIDDLLAKHFTVVGTTGCGKSSALMCILQRILEGHPHAHILVLDVHNEYPDAFGELAESIDPSTLELPLWLLNFQELIEALTSADASYREAEIEILTEAVLAAKRRFFDMSSGRASTLARRPTETVGITVETPTPFRLSDIMSFIDEQLGKLERTQTTMPYRRLKNRIETLVSDPRYAFMFGSLTVQDTMSDILGRLFRVPTDGRPITVINLSTVPAEILDVVISVISRLAFDLAVWSKGALPMLLVCEEAHRYAPANLDKFVPTRQALSRIAKEGRKYGLSLALVTQRPSDLDPTIISQCGTSVVMRLTTERDQQVMRANTTDHAVDLLDFLPLLADREAIILGQGVAMPMRIRFADLGASGILRETQVGFSQKWKAPNMDRETLDMIVARWRSSGRERNNGGGMGGV